jgi:hypothetical protein
MVVWMDGRGRSLLSPPGVGNNSTTNPAIISTTSPVACTSSNSQTSCGSNNGCRLDLRHYGSLTLRDLDNLPSNLVSLSIGPYFATRSISQVIDKIPKEQLEYLDLDISTLMMLHTNTNMEEETDDSLQMTSNLQILLTQIPHLAHLGLHVHPNPFVVPALAHFLPTTTKTQAPLKTLDISGCHMDETDLYLLLDAVMTLQQTSSSNGIMTLRLCDNHITDSGCHVIAQYLRNPECALEMLDLSYNDHIGVDGAMVIFDALRTNPSLRQISFLRCRSLTQALQQPHEHQLANDRRELLLETLLDVFEASSNRVLEYCSGIWTSGESSFAMADKDEDHHFHHLLTLQQHIAYEMALNRCGRGRVLGASAKNQNQTELPDSIWPYFFARLPQDRPSCLFYFLRQTVPVWRFGEQGVT